jgi:Flp pilus assembly protein TadB
MLEWLTLTLIGLIVSGICFFALRRVALARQRLDKRLQPADPSLVDDTPQPLLGPLTPALAAQIPMTAEGKRDLQQELVAAGFYRSTALMEYAAVRLVLVLIPLLGAGVLALMVTPARVPAVLIGGVIAALLGFSLPRLYLLVRSQARARAISRGLPFAVDLLTLCLSAGQNLLHALQWVSRDLRFSHPVLGQELEITHKHALLHSMEQALKQLGDRVRVPEVRDLALILTQSQRLGTDTNAALLDFANHFRVSQRQRAEAQANRTSFWMLFPTLFCLWIGAGLLLVAPVFNDFLEQRRTTSDLLNQGKANLQRSRPAPQTPPTQP